MAESRDRNPFTNTRLMLGGVVFGVIGTILAFVVINKRIEEATGGTVYACFLKMDLSAKDVLSERQVGSKAIPKAYADAVDQMILRKELNKFLGRPPFRDMRAGEPLSVHDFPVDIGAAKLPKPREGSVLYAVKIDSRTEPGRTLRLGRIVSLTGNFNFGETRSGSRADSRTITVLDRVKVMAINSGYERSADKVSRVAVEVSDEASKILTRLLDRQTGGYTIIIHPDDTLATPQGKEVPQDTKTLIIEKVGMPGAVR